MLAKTYVRLSECLADFIMDMKTKHENPAIIIGGDFNKRDPSFLTRSFPDLTTIATGPTRGNETLDLVLTNSQHEEAVVLSPLQTPEGVMSNHSVISCLLRLTKRMQSKWFNYYARERTSNGESKFASAIIMEQWTEILQPGITPSEMVDRLNLRLNSIMDDCFPLKRFRANEKDKPWITHGIRHKIKKKTGNFQEKQRS